MRNRFPASAVVVVVFAVGLAVLGVVAVLDARNGPDGLLGGPGPEATPGVATGTAATRHIALNSEPSEHGRLRSLGYDLVDVKPDDPSIAALPTGMQALLWVGDDECDRFTIPFERFAAIVQRHAGNPKVYGYNLVDEPNPKECPDLVPELRRRVEHLKRHAPGQKSFISLTDWEMKPLAGIHADLIGLDPYPCKGATRPRAQCDIRAIDRMVRMADDAGFPRSRVVPVFQTFGQSCSTGERQYWLPTAAQMTAMLERWDRLAPRPPMDVAYSWGRQDKWVCPGLRDADGRDGRPDLQSVMRAHNLTGGRS